MKKLLFSLFSIACWNYVAIAQPEINSLVANTAGETLKAYSILVADVSPGNAGPNQVWDFSHITFRDDDETICTYHNSSQVAGASFFPSATVVMKDTKISEFTFIQTSLSEHTILGKVKNDGSIWPYSDPLTLFKAPFTYGSTITDEFYLPKDIGQGILYKEYGDLTSTYDGYGTLKTAWGTYNNIVRIKENRVEITERGDDIKKKTIVNYYYTIPGYVTPLFGVAISTDSSSAGEETFNFYFAYYPSFITGNKNVHLQDLKLSVHPNPVSDMLSIGFKDLNSNNYSLKIMGQTGAVVMEQTVAATQGQDHLMNIASLKSGLYFLEVSSDYGKTVKKIIKE
jgi:hypothetical protein